MRGFRARHKAKVVAREEAEAQAALAVVRKHAEAGKKAQQETIPSVWAPPQMWSNPAAAAGPPPPPPPAPPLPAPAAEPVPAELVHVLEVVTTMCDHVVEYIEADRVERRMMIDALTHLVRALGQAIPAPTTPAANGERLIGGSFTAGPDPSAQPDIDIDLTQALGPEVTEPETAVEVKCRFGDRWVDGFEICEALFEGDDLRYRLRRRIDGVVLPELFDAADIRHVETFEELTSTPQHQKYWSAL
jgi:hypothetical protein